MAEPRTADLTYEQLRQLKMVGFWTSPERPDLPDPRSYIDDQWDRGERDLVIAYLENAYRHPYTYLGHSWCRLGCPGIPQDIGTQDRTDGTWLFPEGLVHYVRHHSLRPPAEFLEHVRTLQYSMPVLPEYKWDDAAV